MDGGFIDILPFLPDFTQELANGGDPTNKQSNFKKYLLRLMLSKSKEPFYKHVSENRDVNGPSRVRATISLHDLVQFFMDECKQRFLDVDEGFATYFIHLLARDSCYGLNITTMKERKMSICKFEQFLERCLQKYANQLDPTLCSIKICHFFKNCHHLKLEFVKQECEKKSAEEMNLLMRSILQYPETSSPSQLEEMFVKMQIFIITTYKLGSPSNPLLIKQARQSLNSVLGKGDLQKYVLRKRHNRIEYLKRLGATVCGIIVFNNHNSQEEKRDNSVIRNILFDLEMAQRNTKESLEQGINRASVSGRKGYTCLQNMLVIRVSQQNVQRLTSMTKLRKINKFIILFHLYKRYFNDIKTEFERVQTLIKVAQSKFDCVVDKIRGTLKCRSAIESELIFPHFMYLSEVWSSLILYLHYLVEINKIIEHLEELLSDELERDYNESLEEITASFCGESSFDELMPAIKKNIAYPSIAKNPYLGEFCALTFVLTKGLLVPSQIRRPICRESETQCGFANAEFSNYSEKNLNDLAYMVCHVIFSTVDLVLLFAIDSKIIKQEIDLMKQSETKTKSSQTQTELIKEKAKVATYQPNIKWNVWDYHRATVHLANLRQKQTHSSQSKYSLGVRNAQVQAYNTRTPETI